MCQLDQESVNNLLILVHCSVCPCYPYIMQCLLTNPMMIELLDYAWYFPVRETEAGRERDGEREIETETETGRGISYVNHICMF